MALKASILCIAVYPTLFLVFAVFSCNFFSPQVFLLSITLRIAFVYTYVPRYPPKAHGVLPFGPCYECCLRGRGCPGDGSLGIRTLFGCGYYFGWWVWMGCSHNKQRRASPWVQVCNRHFSDPHGCHGIAIFKDKATYSFWHPCCIWRGQHPVPCYKSSVVTWL